MQRRIARSAIGPVTGTVRSVNSTLPYPSKRCKKNEKVASCQLATSSTTVTATPESAYPTITINAILMAYLPN